MVGTTIILILWIKKQEHRGERIRQDPRREELGFGPRVPDSRAPTATSPLHPLCYPLPHRCCYRCDRGHRSKNKLSHSAHLWHPLQRCHTPSRFESGEGKQLSSRVGPLVSLAHEFWIPRNKRHKRGIGVELNAKGLSSLPKEGTQAFQTWTRGPHCGISLHPHQLLSKVLCHGCRPMPLL